VACLAVVSLAAEAAFPNPSQATASSARTSPTAEDKVDLNSATIDQLMKVPGMTRTWAARIVRFRPYRAKNDLLDRGVVTSEVYNRIKDHIVAHRLRQ
jgi:DNA uptake protein ComE-like DNA-binding protein